MAILFVSPPASYVQGVRRIDHYCIEMSRILNERGHRAVALVPPQVKEREEQYRPAELLAWSATERPHRTLRWVGREVRPRVVQMENCPSLIRPAREWFGGKIGLNLHSGSTLSVSNISPQELRVALCLTDRIITVSQYLSRLFVGRYFGIRGLTQTIHPGVDLHKFKPGENADEAVRQGPILYFSPSTTSLAKAMGDELSLVAGELGVKVLPVEGQPRDSLSSLYQQARLLVYATDRHDSFSYHCAEAMACGLPVIASKLGAIPELVDSTCGHLVRQYRDPATWRRVLEKQLADSAKLAKMREAAAKKATHFSWERTVDQLLAAYGIT